MNLHSWETLQENLELQLLRRRDAALVSRAIDSHNGTAYIALTNGFLFARVAQNGDSGKLIACELTQIRF
jgi:hypothetical protein